MIVHEQVTIRSDLSSVYTAFADIKGWKEFLPDVIDVKVLYDDGYHQEFEMTVQRPAGSETIRAIRYCIRERSIEIFQPVPPPSFKRMSGVWTFRRANNAVVVTAARNFTLRENGAGQQGTKGNSGQNVSTEKLLRKVLKRNLMLFKERLENKCSELKYQE